MITPDLPGHGKDWKNPKDILLKDYTDCVCDILDHITEPAILVGHSRGGIVISQTAEYRPQKIKTLVYVAAFLIRDGQPMIAAALSDKDSLLVSNMIMNEAEGWHEVKPEAVRDALYHDCSDEDVALAKSLLTREPNAPVGTPLSLSEKNFGSVQRVYITALQDRGVSPSVQKQMLAALPCSKVIEMNTSHSPFLSQPDELTSYLLAL